MPCYVTSQTQGSYSQQECYLDLVVSAKRMDNALSESHGDELAHHRTLERAIPLAVQRGYDPILKVNPNRPIQTLMVVGCVTIGGK
jgi:hypothetical protein